MMTGIQKIILTCLLGPEDTKAFKRTLNAEKSKKHRERYPGRYLVKNLSSDKLKKQRRVQRESKARARKDPIFKAYEQITNRDWVVSNPEKSRDSQAVARAKQRERDPSCKLAPNLRGRMGAILKGRSKSGRTMALLGCSVELWKSHLQALFKPGMTWENYGPVWHVDHIKPCILFDLSDPEQQRVCFHWSNTQPLFAEENLKKGDKYAG